MEFFEKLGKKASETYKSAAEKTNKLASETKLKLKISDNKSKIKDIYTEIGKKVYQKYTLDENLCIKEDIKEELERIDELSNEIKGLKSKIEILGINELGDSGITYRIVVDTKPMKHLEIKRLILREIKMTFDKNKIDIPYNQLVIHNA